MLKDRTVILLLLVFVFLFRIGCGDDDDDDLSASQDDDSTPELNDDDDDDVSNDDDYSDDDDDDDDDVVLTEGFVPVPAGSFYMGSPEGEQGRFDDELLHQVTLTRAFEIMTTEVTQGDYEILIGENPSYFPSGPDNPVEYVSWWGALIYANKLSEKMGYAPCYVLSDIRCRDGSDDTASDYCLDSGGIEEAKVVLNDADSVYDCEGYRLPTEAEFEYATRAGTQTAFYSGKLFFMDCDLPDPNLVQIGWYCWNSDGAHKPVGGKLPNDWGLYDLTGNVMEWVWDWYGDYSGDETDPVGIEGGNMRVARGGSWYTFARACRSANRYGFFPLFRDSDVGFRLVRTLNR